MNSFDAFAALVGRDERMQLPLLEAAAQVPQYADPHCDPQVVLRQVHAWVAQLRARIAPDASPLTRFRLLTHFFFGELGFAAARDDYDAVENSFLHRVIERRRGIPITLSLLYVELGRAAGLSLHGVSFPGHFLVRLTLNDGAVFIDVFNGGVSLSDSELRGRLAQLLPDTSEASLARYLRPAADREILARLLRNLKVIHCRAEQWLAALDVMNRLVALLPGSPQERLDRAQAYEQLECPRAAVGDLVAYLSLAVSPADAFQVRGRLGRLQQAAARLN